MSNKRIKGITIEIGSDTVGLEKALSDVNKESSKLQGELKDVERLLKFDPSNTEALAQKQKLLADQVDVTTNKLNQLKEAEKQVQAQFEKGDISEEQYRAFRREVEFTEGSLQKLKTELANADKEQQNIASSTRQLNTLFEATDSSVDDYADTLGIKLTNAIKSGTASSRELDDALDKIGRAALGADVDLDKMKKSLNSIDDGNSVKNVRKDLDNLSKEANEAENSVKQLGVELENIAGALVAGGGIKGTVDQALDSASLDTKIDIIFEVPEESKAVIKAAVRDIEAYGVDSEAALEGVRRQWALNADATDEANQKVVEGAAAIAASYSGIDFTELIQETNEIAGALKISDYEALALTDSLLKVGFPPEQLDIISEYGTQLSMAGYSAEEIQAIFAAGVETDSWNIDNLLDGLKEGRIKLAEFGQEVPKSTQDLIANTDISTKQLQEWGKAAARGGEDGKKAMYEVAQAVNDVEDETTKSQLGVAVWGTKFEDQGQAIIDTILNAEDATMDLKGSQDQLNESTEKLNADPTIQLKQAMADLKLALEPVLTIIADIISKIAEWISDNPKLAAGITAALTVIGIILGLLMALAPIIFSIINLAKILGVVFAALSGPVGIVIAIIAALIAIGVLLYKNWDEIKAKAFEIWGKIKEWFIEVWDNIKSTFNSAFNWLDEKTNGAFSAIVDSIILRMKFIWENIKLAWEYIKNTFKNALDFLKALVTLDFEGMKEAIGNQLENTFNLISGVWNNIKEYTAAVWGSIKDFFISIVESIKTAVSEKFEAMKNAISEKLAAAKELIVDVWNKTEEFFRNIDLKQIGKDIIQGLIDGIEEMAAKLWQKVKDIADGIKNAFTGILDINSPSGVFREYGININEGLIQGIKASTSKLNNAMNSVYGSMGENAYGMMNDSSINNSKSYQSNITIINQSPNASPSEIARKNLQASRQLAMEWGL